MRNVNRRRFAQTSDVCRTGLLGALIVAVACAAPAVSCAQWRPDKTIEIIVGVAPGGALDITARALQRILQGNRATSIPVSVVNRPGAGSAVAWTYMNQHPGKRARH